MQLSNPQSAPVAKPLMELRYASIHHRLTACTLFDAAPYALYFHSHSIFSAHPPSASSPSLPASSPSDVIDLSRFVKHSNANCKGTKEFVAHAQAREFILSAILIMALMMSWLSCSCPVQWQEVENWKMIVLYLFGFLLSTTLCKSKTAFFFRVFLPRLVHFHSSSTAFNERGIRRPLSQSSSSELFP